MNIASKFSQENEIKMETLEEIYSIKFDKNFSSFIFVK